MVTKLKMDLGASLRRAAAEPELAGSRLEAAAEELLRPQTRGGVVDVPIERVRPDPRQPRRYFDPVALEELAASIRQHGILQPILVKPAADGRSYDLVAGERRWRAAQLAGLTHIPATIRTLDDEQTVEAAVTENLQREDLTPLEEAEIFGRMIEELGYSVRRLAERVGKGKGYIEDRLRLLKLDENLRRMVADRPDTLTHAREIAKLEDGAVREALAVRVITENLPLAELRRLMRQATAPTPVGPVSGHPDGAEGAPETGVSGRPDTLS